MLRVLYGYLMACNAADIPFLQFPRDEIIEVRSKSGFWIDHFVDCLHRLSLKATKTRHEESIFLTSPRKLFLHPPRISRSQYRLVGPLPPCLEGWAVRRKELRHRRAVCGHPVNQKGYHSNMLRTLSKQTAKNWVKE